MYVERLEHKRDPAHTTLDSDEVQLRELGKIPDINNSAAIFPLRIEFAAGREVPKSCPSPITERKPWSGFTLTT